MSNESNDYIGIVMGGYLDKNDKLLTRSELNYRISLKDEKIQRLKNEIEKLKNELRRKNQNE